MIDSLFFITFASLACIFIGASIISFFLNRADFADSMWSLGFLLVAWICYLFSPFRSTYALIVSSIITLWSIRLFFHIFLRNRKKEEDFRYQEMKKGWKKYPFLHLLGKVFLLQALILYIVSLPIISIYSNPFSGNWGFAFFALPLWLFGFIFETVSDLQLYFFKKEQKNQGKLFTSGLFSYCRHPNYFGELLQWWAIWLLALAYPMGLITIISPILLSYLIIFVSGIAPLEKKMKNHPDFASYAKSTPSLIPRLFFKS